MSVWSCNTGCRNFIVSENYKIKRYEKPAITRSVRCLCRYELGDDEGAREDLERMLVLNPEMKEHFVAETPGGFFTHLRNDIEQEYLLLLQ